MLLILGLAILGLVGGFVVFSFQPLVGIALIFCRAGGVVLLRKPLWGTLGYVYTMGFVAFFNFPITNDGLKLSTVILIGTLLTHIGMLIIARDWSLLTLPLKRAEHKLVLLFFFVCIISVMNTGNMKMAVAGLKQFSYCIMSYLLILLTVRTKKDLVTVIWVAVLSGFTIGLFGIREMMGESIYKTLNYKSIFGAQLAYSIEKVSKNRINGMVADGDFHGAYMAFMFMLCLFLFFRATNRWHKGLLGFILGVCFFNVFGAAARGAVLGFSIMSIVWWSVWDGKRKVLKAVAVVGPALLVIAVMVLVTDLDIDRVYSPPEGVSARTIDLRFNLFEMSMNMWVDSPILGHGPNGFDIIYEEYAWKTNPTSRRTVASDSMNVYTEVLVEFGLIGAVVFTILIFYILMRAWTLSKRLRGPYRILAFSLLGIFCGYSVFMTTSGHLVDLVYWLILIFIAVSYEILESDMIKDSTGWMEGVGEEESDTASPGPAADHGTTDRT